MAIIRFMASEARTIARERGKRLREARLRAELTQSELAHLLSVADNTISSWERGVNAIPKHIRLALNKTLGLPESSAWIFDGVEISDVQLVDGGAWLIEGSFRLTVSREPRETS